MPILKDQDESVDRFVCCQENAEKPQHHLIALTVRADVFFSRKSLENLENIIWLAFSREWRNEALHVYNGDSFPSMRASQ